MDSRGRRPGAATAALAAIVAITACWWALALWPVGQAGPDWLERTRSACFGAAPGGLPDAGGWILLVGEPLGMLVVLLTVWRRSVAGELRWIALHRGWRIAGAVAVLLAVTSTTALGLRVARAWAGERITINGDGAVLQTLDIEPHRTKLVDQQGRAVSLADFRGRNVLVTFAFGHCTTMCPAIVSGLRAARVAANRADLPLVVITLDPWRDTPDRLGMMAHHWNLAADDRVLSGSVPDVEHVLDTLGIGRKRDETTGDVVHGSTTMLVSDGGRIAWRLDGSWNGVATLLRRLPQAKAPLAAPTR